MKHLLICLLFASCCKEPTCYKIESYVIKKVVPMVYEVTASNWVKTITYTTNSLPMVGNQICF